MLYIVSTPIGNLEDITLRAIRILKEADYITCEDTRHAQKLLRKYEIKTKMISFHSYSGRIKLEKILTLLKEGKNIALISDAGTPGVSDPGYTLIKEAIKNEIKISPIPGASALLAALAMSGQPMNRFVFLGFLPLKKGRQTLLKSLKDEKRTIVFFESPHRLLKTLGQLKEFIGDREVAVCKEMTKIHEEVIRGNPSKIIKYFKKDKIKGECVVIVGAK